MKKIFILFVFICAILLSSCELLSTSHKVEFIYNEDIISSIVSEGNELIEAPSISINEDELFVGWFYDNKSFEKEYKDDDFLDKTLTKNLKIYAYVLIKEDRIDNNFTFSNMDDAYLISVTKDIESIDLNDYIKCEEGAYFKVKGSDSLCINLNKGKNEYAIELYDTYGLIDTLALNVYREKSFVISFDTLGGNSIEDIEVLENGVLENVPEAIKEGYSFKSWDFDFTKAITEDVNAKAIYEAITYNITYVLDGGENSKSNPSTYTIEDNVVLDDAKKSGYSFVSWYSDSSFTNPINSLTYGDITLYAKFSNAIAYNINYNLNGGTNNNSNPNKYTIDNEKIVLKDASKEGYKFEGWYTDATFKNKITYILGSACKDYNIYAKFSLITYSISYYEEGNIVNGLSPITYNVTSNVSLPTMTKDGYKFEGWYLDANFKTKIEKISAGETGDKKLYAKFSELEKVSVNVLLDPNGGEIEGLSKEFDLRNPICEARLTMYLTYDSTYGYYASLAKKTGNLYFYYILLNKSEFENVYEIIEIAYPRTDIASSSFDYVIAWHGALQDSTAKATLSSIYENRSDYIGRYVYFEGLPSSESSSCEIKAKFYDVTSSYGSYFKTYKEEETLPVPKKEGYTFKGYVSSLDGLTYYSYPGYVTNPGDIVYTAKWIKNSLSGTEIEDAISYLDDFMSKHALVSESINLPLAYLGCTITYESSDVTSFSNTGQYSAPYTNKYISLKAYVTDGTNSEQVTYSLQIKGEFKDLSNGVVAGYVYFSNTSVSDYTFENLNIIYLAFGYITKTGDIQNISSIGRYLPALIQKAHANGTRVLISMQESSSSDETNDAFDEVGMSEAVSNTFAENCVKYINQYGFDGIDIDWEFPNSSESTYFTTLVKALHTKIKANNPNHLVTTATGISSYNRYDLGNAKAYLDYINIMTYDMQVSGASFQNGLYSSSGNSSYYIDKYVKNYMSLGISPSKLIIGIPFYGRKFIGATGLRTGSANGATAFYNIVSTYLNTDANIKKYRVWDDDAKVPYIFDRDGGVIISYDDPESIAIKCEYAYNMKLAGLMYWQDSQDDGDTLVSAIVNGVNENYRK